jgi:hypothetical protein
MSVKDINTCYDGIVTNFTAATNVSDDKGGVFYDFEFTKAKAAITQLLDTASTKMAKAYGGCIVCYGKGYHTKRVGTSSRYGNVTHDTIGYCSCSRGKQLESVVDTATREAKLAVLKELFHFHKGEPASLETIQTKIIDRIAELERGTK